jgi:hypothetical protein
MGRQRRRGLRISSCAQGKGVACVQVEGVPDRLSDSLAALISRWPNWQGQHAHQAGPFSTSLDGGTLYIFHAQTARVQRTLPFPEAGIVRRFEQVAQFWQSLSDALLLQALQREGKENLPLRFDPDRLDEDMGAALARLRLRNPVLIRVAQELQSQLALVFGIRSMAQLVLKLSIILDDSLQIVCADFQRALINAFWDWADENKLYVLFRLLEKQGIKLSDTAFFLYYTKLLDKVMAMRRMGVDAVTSDGRLRLPLADDALPRAIPRQWWRDMQRRFAQMKAEMGASLVSMQTEPPIWEYDDVEP